jgi:hypothetical protein
MVFRVFSALAAASGEVLGNKRFTRIQKFHNFAASGHAPVDLPAIAEFLPGYEVTVWVGLAVMPK